MPLTDDEVKALSALPHDLVCAWHDDGDWNSATFANFFRSTGEHPTCSCGPFYPPSDARNEAVRAIQIKLRDT